MAEANLNALLDTRRVLLCVGCGGVGKTTTCASLGLAAARRGKRVLCLTIDPARRLAQSLGLGKFTTEAQKIAPEVFEAAGLDVPGELTVMMLDTKSTFDGLVTALAPTEEKRQSVLQNALYEYISSSLAGTQEYMAMEKLYEVKDDPAYDLVLLDTPPTSHALDFLDAPERLVNAIDSAAVRWFFEAFQSSGKLSFNLLQKSASVILKGIGKITGGGFLEQVATFLTEMNDLFGGWRARADEVSAALRDDDVAYVLVTTPEPMSIREVQFFAERLRKQSMTPDAYVVNRVHTQVPEPPGTEAIGAALDAAGLSLGDDASAKVLEATQQARRLAEVDRLHLYALDDVVEGAVVVKVPDFPRDIHDVTRLAWVQQVIAPAG